jgi:1,4-dihydroxy-2-naphthoate octaprenyltransferase
MFRKSTWLHLRIPFSFFLLPVYLFAVAVSPNLNTDRLLLVFLALHIFLYPASNGYNSYFDKDEGSIGGLKNPPGVSKGLYYTALLFDVVAICLGILINYLFAIMLFVYGLVSKAYSHPAVRIKKYAWGSWLIAGLFQGWFTFLMAYCGINDLGMEVLLKPHVQIPAFLSSVILWGSYPMTQVYQHKEDSRRGDNTLSLKLGVLGTFHFTAIMFTVATFAFCIFFAVNYSWKYAFAFVIAMFPVVAYFIYWYLLVRKDEGSASFTHAMRLNFLSSLFLNAFFIYFFLDHTHVLQAVQAGY